MLGEVGTDEGEPMARMPRRRPPQGLTAFQVEVGQVFFALSQSEGFLVVGEAALAAHRLTDRPTRDLQLVRVDGGGPVRPALEALQADAVALGWAAVTVPDEGSASVLLLEGQGGERLLAALAPGDRPAYPATLTLLGPTLAANELAGRLVAAVAQRAGGLGIPGDLVDVEALSRRYPRRRLVRLASEADPRFDPAALARALTSLSDLPDGDLPARPDRLPQLRGFARRWAAELLQR